MRSQFPTPAMEFDKGWWKNQPRRNVWYGDTDSVFIRLRVDLNFFLNSDDTIDTQKLITVTVRLGNAIQTRYKEVLCSVVRSSDRFNLMNAKLEVISGGASLFAKKNYIIAPLFYDEGTVFDLNESLKDLHETDLKKFWLRVKKKGGVFAKKDTPFVTIEMMEEIYLFIIDVLDRGDPIFKSKRRRREAINAIVKKYINRVKEYLGNQEFDKVCQTKKFPIKELKTVPKHMLAGKLFNTIVNNRLRGGDSFYVLDVKLQKHLLPVLDGEDKYILTKSDLRNLSQIAIPTEMNNDERNLLIERMREYQIEPDVRKITEFALLKKRDTIDLHYRIGS
jgi:hypothetical protein